MPSAKILLLVSLSLLWGHLTPATAQAEPLQLCVRADRVVEGRPKEGAKIILRSQCKTRANGTPIEISIGDSDAIGGAEPCGSIEGVYVDLVDRSYALRVTKLNGERRFRLELLDGHDVQEPSYFSCDDLRPTLGNGFGAYCNFDDWLGTGITPVFLSRIDCDTLLIVGQHVRSDFTQFSRFASVCGDRIVDNENSEECDAGGETSRCDPDCTLPACGDGFINTSAGEVCDDENLIDGDGCSADCQSDETCGNGITDLAAGEDCDDGGVLPGDGCSETCQAEGCGDGVLNPGEVCDDDNRVDGDGCSSDCQSDETCGNGVVDEIAGETCDSGGMGIDCDTDCTRPICGDGIVNGVAGEICEDGNTMSGDGCSADCRSDETCGNGVVDEVSGEECDPGSSSLGFACGDDCKPNSGLAKLNGLWQVLFYPVRFGAHAVVVDGADLVFSKRQGSLGGTTLGPAQCSNEYTYGAGGLTFVQGNCGTTSLDFSTARSGQWGDWFPLSQIVSCPGKSLAQIEAGECVPVPSPSGAFVDGAPVW